MLVPHVSICIFILFMDIGMVFFENLLGHKILISAPLLVVCIAGPYCHNSLSCAHLLN